MTRTSALGPIAEDCALRDAFVLLRDAMRKSNVAAIARAVLLRKMRTILLRAHSIGLIATALNEVRSSAKAFDEIPKLKMEGAMLDLTKHIIGTKKEIFNPAEVDDSYEIAVAVNPTMPAFPLLPKEILVSRMHFTFICDDESR
ncbi:DNA end-binding protein Ku [Rhizobium mongolense]|uniref:DNA end-binding protein Ku n=1 Tax=Rhizobium mongolense TaxID=57676 RepID=A0ABR6IX96_9HYPH|nr:DNA end-binding protein Ku [Rhizobium mongolense]